MSNEESFNGNKEAGEGNIQEVIKYKKESKRKYFKMSALVILGAVSFFCVSFYIAEHYFHKSTHQQDKNNEDKNIENAIKTIQKSIVSISDIENKLMNESYETGNLSGVVLGEDGVILTSYSLVKDFQKIFVKPAGNGVKPREGRLMFFNEEVDIAMIKLDDIVLTPAKTIDFNKVKEGKLVLSVGNAIGSDHVGFVTMGIINSISQKVTCDFTGEKYRVIQVDSKFSEGNYGGAVIDINGEVIGICSKYLTDTYGKGYYALVDIETIKNIIVKVFEEIDRLGLSGSFVKNQELQGVYGVYVANVKKDGPAYISGIKPTDIIIKINGEQIVNISDAYDMLAKYGYDKIINLTILRDGKEINKEIKLE